METFTVIVAILYVAIIVVSFYFFNKWVKEFSGKPELTNGVWVVVMLAAISVPTFIINCLSLLVTCIAWLVLLF